MKKAISIFILSILCVTNIIAKTTYKPSLGVGINYGCGDNYGNILDRDGCVNYSIFTEHCALMGDDINNYGFFVGFGIGLDFANTSDFHKTNETSFIDRRYCYGLPIYMPFGLVYNVNKISMKFQINAGYYRWFGHSSIDGEYCNYLIPYDYRIDYPNNLLIGGGIGVRFPFNKSKAGINIMLNYSYIGWIDHSYDGYTLYETGSCNNHKIGISCAFDF